jgi:quinol-cytochrome oxidoreductase complex cytochrome b subunit
MKTKSAPDLVRKEGLAIIVSLAALCLLAGLVDAPLNGPADTGGIPSEDIKAPWIFVGIQFMLRHIDALIAGIIIPLVLLLALAYIPFFPRSTSNQRKALTALFLGICVISVALTVWGYVL